LLTKS